LHTHISYYYKDRNLTKTPSEEEINKYRLWKCSKCNEWITFRSKLLKEHNENKIKFGNDDNFSNCTVDYMKEIVNSIVKSCPNILTG